MSLSSDPELATVHQGPVRHLPPAEAPPPETLEGGLGLGGGSGGQMGRTEEETEGCEPGAGWMGSEERPGWAG